MLLEFMGFFLALYLLFMAVLAAVIGFNKFREWLATRNPAASEKFERIWPKVGRALFVIAVFAGLGTGWLLMVLLL